MASNFQTPLGSSAVLALPDVPGGFLPNDLIMAFIFASWTADFGDTLAIQEPLGWNVISDNLIAYTDGVSGDRMGAYFWDVDTVGDVPSALTFTWVGEAFWAARLVCYRNVRVSNQPITINPMVISAAAANPVAVDVEIDTILPNTRVVGCFGARTLSTRGNFTLSERYNLRSQETPSSSSSGQAGGFRSFGTFPDQGISGADPGDIFNVITVADRVIAAPGTVNLTGTVTASDVSPAADRLGMGMLIRLNEAGT